MKIENEKVVVVTVTYNSSQFLRRQVESLRKSTIPVDKIVVVDNKSNDEHWDNVKKIALDNAKIDLLRQTDNLGGAGGFEKGVEYVLEKYSDYDWMWIMDDDAFPREDCLEKLLKFKDVNNLGCLSPMIYGVELKEYQYYHPKNASKFLNSNIAVTTDIKELSEITPIEINAFVGPLVKLSVVKKIGVPDGKLFIYGDDREYTYRITRSFKMFLVRDAVINHRDEVMDNGKINPKGIWKEYYHYRNSVLFIRKYKRTTLQEIIGELLLVKDAVRTSLSTLKHTRYRHYRGIRIRCVWKGLGDGLFGKSGKSIDPVEFNKKYIHQ